MTFKKEKYKIIRKAVSKDIVDFVNNYILLKEQVHTKKKESYTKIFSFLKNNRFFFKKIFR